MDKKRFFGAWGFIVGMLSYGNLALAQADAVFTNGRIYTVNRQEALCGSRGRQGREVRRSGFRQGHQGIIGKRTSVVDLGGAFAMPGFVDAHIHRRSRTCRRRAALCSFPRVSARSKSLKHSPRT